MVMIDHSELLVNMSEQTTSEDESAQRENMSCRVSTDANRERFERTVTRMIVSILPPTRNTC